MSLLRASRPVGLMALSCAGILWVAAVEPDDRRLVGDWETPDAFLLAHQSLWQESLDALLDALPPRSVYLITEPSEATGRVGEDGVLTVGLLHESAWVRDYGPIQVQIRGDPIWLDAEYHPSRPRDDAVASRLGRELRVPVEHVPYRLEGGGISSDGMGLCAMTSASLRRLDIPDTQEFTDQLGCRSLEVLPSLSSEPTGHVDQIVHFLRPGVVAVGALAADSQARVDAARLDMAAGLLRRAAARTGRILEVVRVPIHLGKGGEFFSYVNVVDLEDALLVPDFDAVPDEVQAEAYHVLRRASGKKLVPIPADAIALAGGGLHCIVLGLHIKALGDRLHAYW